MIFWIMLKRESMIIKFASKANKKNLLAQMEMPAQISTKKAGSFANL